MALGESIYFSIFVLITTVKPLSDIEYDKLIFAICRQNHIIPLKDTEIRKSNKYTNSSQVHIIYWFNSGYLNLNHLFIITLQWKNKVQIG